PEFSYTIERGKLREFLLAIEDNNPAYRVDDPPLPPTFPTVFMFWGGGDIGGVLRDLGVEMKNVLHAEQEYEYLAPLHVGDTVTGRTQIADIYSKKGRSGEMQFVELLTEYTNQHGEPVLKDRALIIVRE
ncbi:MAG TPA: MaoC family dehydratase, partial [Chloroflexi bacterium]|nr:MaoC family dehydratase [Chloroflexota bacterium]